MGKGQSKAIISTLTANLRLSTKEESGDPSEQVNLIRFRSGSLDSISTALSFGIGQHAQQHHHKSSPTRSCSLDNLCSEMDYRNRVEQHTDRGKRLNLLDPPIANGNTSCQTKKVLPKDRGLTHSLPSEIQRHLLMDYHGVETMSENEQLRCQSASPKPQREKDLDAFSDNFVTLETTIKDNKTSASQEPKLPIKSILKDPQHIKVASEALAAANGGRPEIPPGVLEKLSADDRRKLSQYIQSICTTVGHSLGHTLTQSIQEPRVPLKSTDDPQIAEASSSSLSDRTPSPSSGSIKHVRIVEDELRLEEGSDEHHTSCGDGTSPREERVRRRRERYQRERPNSLPPEYLKDSVSGESQGTEVDGCEDLQDVVRSRSRSHEECYYYQCKTPDDIKARRKTYGRRKKSGRSSRNRDSIVDTSIDDNCPGVPENRVGRHRHHHHHVVCARCFEGFRDATMSPRSRRHKHRHRNSGELDVSQELNFGQNESSSYYITLQDMKTSAKMLTRGVGTGEAHESSGGGRHNNLQCKSHSKGMYCQRQNYSEEVEGLSTVPPECSQVGSNKMLNNNSWRDLAFPVTSRTGRDSPHTDMAVHDLDLDSPRMMQPLELSDKNNMPLASSGVDGTVKHFYLHDHHHYHHIIHHNKL